MKSLLVLVFSILLMGELNAQKAYSALPKYAPSALKEDADILKKTLEANHPSLYWYTSKQQLDSAYEVMMNSINDSLNEIEYKNKLATWVALIKCGHTTTQYSKRFIKELPKNRYPRFPLQIKFWEDSAVVLSNGYFQDSMIRRGTIVQSINNKPIAYYRDSLFKQIALDGNASNHQYQTLSSIFPDGYKQVFGIDSTYLIGYINEAGKPDTISLGNFAPIPRDTGINKPRPIINQTTLSKRQLRLLSLRSLSIDTITRSAYFRLTTFSKGNLKTFFRRSFKTLKKENIQHLILDLRENGGGRISNSIALTKYLKQTPFKIADSVIAISRKFKHGKYIQSSWMYWLAMNLGASKAADGSIHYKRFEEHNYQPRNRFAFKGNAYLVQGGYTFSAATMVIGALKGQENILVIGEESGGGQYGNSAMHIPQIILPNTKLRVRLPLYRMVINQRLPKGRGIEPDIKIPPSSYAIRMGFDPKMAAIQALIKSKNN
ncbi:S41 family peptidase [Sediminibacterium sp.]|uniref:S41 family peptidase n=1 Tax=Sediminibacterium sp. TaxID=1917865 RepID=UPI003F6E4F98